MNAQAECWKQSRVTAVVILLLALASGSAGMAQAPSAQEPPPTPAAAADAPPPVVAAPDVAAGGEAGSTVSEAEVASLVNEAMGDSSDSGEGEGFTPKLRFYGFMDATATAIIYSSDTSGDSATDAFLGPGLSFRVGNINLYADAVLTDTLRSMAEVRFTYLPNGSLDTSTFKRTRSTPADYTQTYRPVPVGGVIIERAYFEYSPHSAFKLRVGHFITPVGVWNVDHSSVVIVPIGIPYPVGEGLIPLSQTGLEAFGSGEIGDFTLGYDLTLSNGRGGAAEYLDLDKNKGIGGRLYASYHGASTVTLGFSGYKGRATYADVGVNAAGSLQPATTLQYDEIAGAVDFVWKWDSFLLQSEFLISQIGFTDAGRPRGVIPTPYPGNSPDFRRLGLYVLAGYRFKWLGVMPYLEFNYHDTGYQVPPPTFNDVTLGRVPAYIVGVNIRPIPTFVLKVEALLVDFHAVEALGSPRSGLGSLWVQTAWSF